jgi:hypothetical protein
MDSGKERLRKGDEDEEERGLEMFDAGTSSTTMDWWIRVLLEWC